MRIDVAKCQRGEQNVATTKSSGMNMFENFKHFHRNSLCLSDLFTSGRQGSAQMCWEGTLGSLVCRA